jgi:transcriptional regulator GlxA family with amidase domain
MAKIGSFVPKGTEMTHNKISIHVSLVVIPDVMLSSLLGLFDVLNCFELLATFDEAVLDENPFHAEIIAQTHEDKATASGLTVAAHRTIEEIDYTDIIIIPSMMVEISWAVGYEDPSFFRRLFKRITNVTPGAYRRKFRLPDFVNTGKRNQT